MSEHPEPTVLGLRVPFLWGARCGVMGTLAVQLWWSVLT